MTRPMLCISALAALLAGTTFSTLVEAKIVKRKPVVLASQPDAGGAHPKSAYYHGPQVRGFVQRRGGYSYSVADTINTYGDSRSTNGSNNSYRDPFSDRQTRMGPFDHGFFFDSGIAPRGGDSPYRN
jgi:hypothetical protein